MMMRWSKIARSLRRHPDQNPREPSSALNLPLVLALSATLKTLFLPLTPTITHWWGLRFVCLHYSAWNILHLCLQRYQRRRRSLLAKSFFSFSLSPAPCQSRPWR